MSGATLLRWFRRVLVVVIIVNAWFVITRGFTAMLAMSTVLCALAIVAQTSTIRRMDRQRLAQLRPRPDYAAIYRMEREIYGETFEHDGAPVPRLPHCICNMVNGGLPCTSPDCIRLPSYNEARRQALSPEGYHGEMYQGLVYGWKREALEALLRAQPGPIWQRRYGGGTDTVIFTSGGGNTATGGAGGTSTAPNTYYGHGRTSDGELTWDAGMPGTVYIPHQILGGEEGGQP